jgi:hypothetical protein
MAGVDIEAVGKAFVGHFYNLFDGDRKQLVNIYQDQSMLTYENERAQGKVAIMNKLMNLSFKQIKHVPTTIDVQPSPGNGILIFVCGNLAVDGNNQPIKFSEVFNLMPVQGQQGGYWLLNDMFRLNYC